MYPQWQDTFSVREQGSYTHSLFNQGIGTHSFFKTIEETLPPIFTRQTASKVLGGLISSKTLSNLDSKGKGPRKKIKIGSKVGYERADFMQWLKQRMQD